MQDQFLALLTAISTYPTQVAYSTIPVAETRKRQRDEPEKFTPSKKHKPAQLKYIVVIPDFDYLRRHSVELYALQTRSTHEKGFKFKLFIPEPVHEELVIRRNNQSESCKEALWHLDCYHRLCMDNNTSTHSVFRIWQHKELRYSAETFLACVKEIAPKFDQCDILVLTTHVDYISSYFSDPRIVVTDRVQNLVQM
uniref:Uncharacterized protein n=1 Tax=Clandestinovirus TaxID=2831644 RepID=A0A8F8KQ96_9VIRU|nr:hypothetical protein KOM_12_537 [Clandestinovirus]